MKPFAYDINRNIDVIAMGRVAVDLYAEQIGTPLQDVSTFKKYLGGCAGNIAVGTARLNLISYLFSCVGQDDMGKFLLKELQKEKVNTDFIDSLPNHLTGLVLLGICPPDHFPLMFYRENCADMQFTLTPPHKNIIAEAKTILVTGTSLSTHTLSKTTHLLVDHARAVNTKVIVDLDYRPVLWGIVARGNGETRYEPHAMISECYRQLIKKADVLVGTEEEFLIASGENNLSLAIDRLRKTCLAPFVVKKGSDGCDIYFNDSDTLNCPGFPVKVLNVLGAGDAFMSGLLRGLLRGESWNRSAQFANACGAIVVTRHGCAPAMPNEHELFALLEEAPNVTLSH